MKKIFYLFFTLLFAVGTVFAQPATTDNLSIEFNSNNDGYISSLKSQERDVSLNEMLYSLGNVFTFLENNYLYDIDNNEMQLDLIEAMVNSLGDKYSYFVRPTDAEEFSEETGGTYVGIGTYLTKMNPEFIDPDDPETYMVIITSPFPGGPADRAGLRANDLISHVNGEDISSLNATEASKLIRGKAGESITLTVHRGTSVFDITLMPEVVTTPTSEIQLLEGNIGYLTISQFSQSTYESVFNHIKELIDMGATSLIIDLRNNGGGIVDSALSIANMFVKDKTLLTTGYKEGSNNRDIVYTASSSLAVSDKMPLVILVNEGTASASEILTAALQENDRAVVVGTQTFGKGIMQSVIPYMNGYLNITTARYFTPDGNDIHGVGITPDYVIETTDYSDEEIAAYEEFMKEDYIEEWLKKRPEYSKKNIEDFAKHYSYTGVPEDLLHLLMRNEYIYSLDYENRPIADPDFDKILKKAIEVIKNK